MLVRRPLAVFAAVATLAAWLDFSRLHEAQHGDSLVPVLTGLTAWTPFFWGQDRFGMLIPLLALPVRDPAAHLLFQGFLVIGLSVWGLLLLVRSLLPSTFPWVAPAAFLLVLLLLVAPEDERFDVLWVQPYTLSFSLGLSALELLRRRGPLRLAGGALLLCASAWVNVGVGLVVAPLLVWRVCFVDRGCLGQARVRFLLIGIGLLALATFLSHRLSLAVHVEHTTFTTLPVAGWRGAATHLLGGAWANADIRRWVGYALVFAAVGLLSLASKRLRSEAGPALIAAAGLAATATVAFAAAATSQWVAGNGYSLRYLTPSLLLLEGAGCLLATLPLLLLSPHRQGAVRWGSVGVVAAAVLLAVGPPSYRAVVNAFESRWGASARDVIAGRATHVAGDYWKVWPTVFYASWLLGTPGRGAWPYGLTDRSIATLRAARSVAHPRVALLDNHAVWFGLLAPRRWAVAEHLPTCLILTAP